MVPAASSSARSLPWRHVALCGAIAGLAGAPLLPPLPLPGTAAAALLLLGALALARHRPATSDRLVAWPWLGVLALLAACAGSLAGEARTAAIDAGAYSVRPGERVAVRGFVARVPRVSRGLVSVLLDTADGRLVVEAPQPDSELVVGGEVRAIGRVRAPPDWQAGRLAIAGAERIVAAGEIEPTGRSRGGVSGLLDQVRERAQAALERGVPDPEAALARGFVLGQDDRIDEATVQDFRRSGLAHLLAVSGQNVLLLALLAMPVLGLLGVGLRARLVVVIALVVLYVPITGAGPSIQRAAVMGIAGLAAALAGRPSHRWYVVLLAAALTLALNPRAGADVGWQLSFAAVVGILFWSRPLARASLRLLRRARPGRSRGAPADERAGAGIAGPLCDGIGVTLAATLATAPVSAFHFEVLSLASLPANLLALPAVAPVMWLGMIAAALGQVPWIPVEPINWLSSLLIAYIAQVGHWLGTPAWAAVEIPRSAIPALAATGLGLSVLAGLGGRALARRSGQRRPVSRGPLLAAAVVAALAILVPLPRGGPAPAATPAKSLSIVAFDVGQGDSILLDPDPGAPVLVDAGPPGTDLVERLEERGVGRLAAVVATHDHSDHVGGLAELLRSIPAEAVVHAAAGRRVKAIAAGSGAKPTGVAAGNVLRSGALRLEVLAPERADPGSGLRLVDPNERSIVLLARWHRFRALLTGDAEAEIAPLDPGRVDLLKVAHHGSEDAGLPALLDGIDPSLAMISVGAGNRYGHPHPSTLAALGEASVPLLRTDLAGNLEVSVSAGRISVGD